MVGIARTLTPAYFHVKTLLLAARLVKLPSRAASKKRKEKSEDDYRGMGEPMEHCCLLPRPQVCRILLLSQSNNNTRMGCRRQAHLTQLRGNSKSRSFTSASHVKCEHMRKLHTQCARHQSDKTPGCSRDGARVTGNSEVIPRPG